MNTPETPMPARFAPAPPADWGIYPITGRLQTGGLDYAEIVGGLIDGGARVVQLRAKELRFAELERLAARLAERCDIASVAFILNDRPEIAARIVANGGAGAGAHIGQDDGDPRRAREALGPGRLLGFSTHNLAQVEAAVALHEAEGGALFDYLAFGPLFDTTTKKDPDPRTGLEVVRARVRAMWPGQLVGIGGITRGRLREVAAAGIDAAAVIGAAMAPTREEIAGRMRDLRAAWEAAKI